MPPNRHDEHTPDDSRSFPVSLPAIAGRVFKVERHCAEFEAEMRSSLRLFEETLKGLREGSSDGGEAMTRLEVAQAKLDALPQRLDRLEGEIVSMKERFATLQGRIYGAVGIAMVFVPVATAGLSKLFK